MTGPSEDVIEGLRKEDGLNVENNKETRSKDAKKLIDSFD